MKTYLATAVAIATAVAQPAYATTFPTLTTIYVGSGVHDSGSLDNVGIATVFNCSNVSGVTASIRYLVLNHLGSILANQTFTIFHGTTGTLGTHLTSTFDENGSLATGSVGQGVINIESTQSGVFCNAMIVDAADAGEGITLPLVRVNPHPGTVE